MSGVSKDGSSQSLWQATDSARIACAIDKFHRCRPCPAFPAEIATPTYAAKASPAIMSASASTYQQEKSLGEG